MKSYMNPFSILRAGALVLGVLIMATASPAGAVKIYLNPSDQIHNTSPDETYNEAAAMKIVAQLLAAKLTARGFEVQNSDGGTMSEATTAAMAWPADIFISLHSNAGAGPGWGKAHGTNTLYYQNRDGSPPNPISIELATRADEKVVEKMTTYGRGYNFRITADLPFLGYPLYVLRKTDGIPGTLVEGLFHDNLEDTAVLKTDEGKDAYAQGVYEALCDHFGWNYYPDAPFLDLGGPAENNADGRMELIVPGVNGRLYRVWQTGGNGAWNAGWDDMAGKSVGAAAQARSSRGRLEVFILGAGGRVQHKFQSSPGATTWNGWYDLGGRMASDPVAGHLADGRLAVVALGTDKRVWLKTQRTLTSSLMWDNWVALEGKFASKPMVCAGSDGRLVVFVVDAKGAVWCASQKSATTRAFNAWHSLGGSVFGNPVAIKDGPGRLAVFARGADGHVLSIGQQTPGGKWGAWQDLGGAAVGNPAVSVTVDGLPVVFINNTEGIIHHSTPAADGKWSSWSALPGAVTGAPIAARNKDGRIEIFARSADGHMLNRVQREPGETAVWDGWYTLGDTESRF